MFIVGKGGLIIMMSNVERISRYLGLKIQEKVFQGSLMKYFGKQLNVIVEL